MLRPEEAPGPEEETPGRGDEIPLLPGGRPVLDRLARPVGALFWVRDRMVPEACGRVDGSGPRMTLVGLVRTGALPEALVLGRVTPELPRVVPADPEPTPGRGGRTAPPPDRLRPVGVLLVDRAFERVPGSERESSDADPRTRSLGRREGIVDALAPFLEEAPARAVLEAPARRVAADAAGRVVRTLVGVRLVVVGVPRAAVTRDPVSPPLRRTDDPSRPMRPSVDRRPDAVTPVPRVDAAPDETAERVPRGSSL